MILKLRIIFAVILVLLVSRIAGAQDASATASIATKGELYLGQRVILAIELRVPGIFSGAPIFQLPPTPGLLLAPPVGSPTLSAETKNDISYTIQRHELSVFPRHDGKIEIPPITVRLSYKKNPLDKDAASESITTLPISFDCKTPPGAEKLGGILSARNLKVDETWSPNPATAHPKAGDAFTRTIHYIAPEIPAMAFPPFPARKADGIALYPKPPEVLDHSDRGNLTGERRDTIVYVCQQEGTFTLPAARLTWWDLDAKKLQTIDFPAQTFTVVPNPAAHKSAATTVAHTYFTPKNILTILAIALAGALLIYAAIRLHLPRHIGALVQHTLAKFRPVHLAPLNPLALLLVLLAFPSCTADEAPRLPRDTAQVLIERDHLDEADGASFDATNDLVIKRIKTQYDNFKAGKISQPPVLNILIISGGGDWGAFGAGFLKGWAKNPDPKMTRPTFDYVTGVSTGALIAPFAFLGDDASIETINHLYRNPQENWLELRPMMTLLRGGEAFASIPGLEKELKDHVTLDLIKRIADAESQGRGLAVNTTDIDSAEPRAFNLTAEAKKCVQADSPNRFHQIMLASSAIPGAFPPRLIDNTLYVDGGVTSNILYGRPRVASKDTFLERWVAAYPNEPIPPVRFWIIFNNQLRYSPQTIQPKWSNVLMRSTNASTHASTLVGIRQVFLMAEVANLKYKADVQVRFVTIPNSWKAPKEGIFQKETMNNLADIGQAMGAQTESWRTEPP